MIYLFNYSVIKTFGKTESGAAGSDRIKSWLLLTYVGSPRLVTFIVQEVLTVYDSTVVTYVVGGKKPVLTSWYAVRRE
jgi:hypothetical protein